MKDIKLSAKRVESQSSHKADDVKKGGRYAALVNARCDVGSGGRL